MVNYLSLLGWSPGGDREFFDSGVLVAEFSTDRSPATPRGSTCANLRRSTATTSAPWTRRILPAASRPCWSARGFRVDPGAAASRRPAGPDPHVAADRGGRTSCGSSSWTRPNSRSRSMPGPKRWAEPAGGVARARWAKPSKPCRRGTRGARGQPVVGGGAAGAEPAQGLGTCTGGGDGPDGVAAALRVDGAARPRPHASSVDRPPVPPCKLARLCSAAVGHRRA